MHAYDLVKPRGPLFLLACFAANAWVTKRRHKRDQLWAAKHFGVPHLGVGRPFSEVKRACVLNSQKSPLLMLWTAPPPAR